MSEYVSSKIRAIVDFPKKGIIFRDITTATKDAKALKEMVDFFVEKLKDKKIDYIAGIESRGFVFGSALAYALGVGFIFIRKPGKLPAEVISAEYSLEYGTDKIEMHKDAVEAGKNVFLVDDLLATGGTMEAAIKLIKKCDANPIAVGFVVELDELNGRQKLNGTEIISMLHF